MIARANNANGHAGGRLPAEIVDQVFELDRDRFERRSSREAGSTYAAGTVDRMNPLPQGIDPLGPDAFDAAYQVIVARSMRGIGVLETPNQPAVPAVQPTGLAQPATSSVAMFERNRR